MRLGILGGTFDPIHYAHLFVAEEARVRTQLDRVVFVPSARPPHKRGTGEATAEHRTAMCELAVAGNPHFCCSRLEIDRPGTSYSVDTVRALRDANPRAELFFITGADTIPEIPTWHQWQELVNLCRFIAAERPGYGSNYAEAQLPSELLDRIVPLSAAHLDISSTDLRRRVRAGLPIRYLTPDAVVEYIENNRLYLG